MGPDRGREEALRKRLARMPEAIDLPYGLHAVQHTGIHRRPYNIQVWGGAVRGDYLADVP